VVNENVTFLGNAKVGTGEVTPGLTFACRAKRDQQRSRLRQFFQPLA
jgi:hypothetical protein